jgi:hypothetical protein
MRSEVMEQPTRKRAERSDKGEVRMRPRDAEALAWLAQMYGAPLDVLATVLGTTERGAREVVRRWRNAGWAEQARVDAGPAWVWPTPTTARQMLGWQVGTWRPSPTMAAHVRAVAEVRLALAGTDLEAWLSERHIAHLAHGYKQAGEKLAHLPDGVWLRGGTDESDNVLVEVELTAKHPKRTEAILQEVLTAASERGAREVWYIAGSGHVRGVVERAAGALRQRTNEQWVRKLRVMDLGAVIEGREGRDQ